MVIEFFLGGLYCCCLIRIISYIRVVRNVMFIDIFMWMDMMIL